MEAAPWWPRTWDPRWRGKGVGLDVSRVKSGKFSNSSRNELQKQKRRLSHGRRPKPHTHPVRTSTVHPEGAELSSDSGGQTGTPLQAHTNHGQEAGKPVPGPETHSTLTRRSWLRPSPKGPPFCRPRLPPAPSPRPHLSPPFPSFWLVAQADEDRGGGVTAGWGREASPLRLRGAAHLSPERAQSEPLLRSDEHCSALQGRGEARLGQSTPDQAGGLRPRDQVGRSALSPSPSPLPVPTRTVGRRHERESGRAGRFLYWLRARPALPAGPLRARCGAGAAAPSCRPACGCTARRTG